MRRLLVPILVVALAGTIYRAGMVQAASTGVEAGYQIGWEERGQFMLCNSCNGSIP